MISFVKMELNYLSNQVFQVSLEILLFQKTLNASVQVVSIMLLKTTKDQLLLNHSLVSCVHKIVASLLVNETSSL